jgi:hypothetical protein
MAHKITNTLPVRGKDIFLIQINFSGRRFKKGKRRLIQKGTRI